VLEIRKFLSLKPAHRLRKAVNLLYLWQQELQNNSMEHADYFMRLAAALAADLNSENSIPDAASVLDRLFISLQDTDRTAAVRQLERLRSLLAAHTGAAPADWDFSLSREKSSMEHPPLRLPVRVFLDELRAPFNVGSIFRTAESFCYDKILLAPGTADPAHPRAGRTAMGCTELLPWSWCSYEELEKEENVFALETGGTDISSFFFPEKGCVIVGSEELGTSPEALKIADKKLGRVSIPLYGSKGSINAAGAFSILSYAWIEALKKRGLLFS
jgi:TrmH family RNA methyltransferase